jgi:plasmid stabilization system protein ParE
VLKLRFHPDVVPEIETSYYWYQEQSAGLGEDFLDELETAYQAIIEFPATWPPFHKGFRRYLLSTFPYSVIYKQKDNSIFVVAVMHNSRKPGYWLNRT